MEIEGTRIEDTFAEAFRMRFVRLVVTAADAHWLDAATREFSGYSSSIISCDCETGIERLLSPDETPDGRPGAAMLVFGFSAAALASVAPDRVGQCVMTCPTTALYDGLTDGEKRIALGKTIRYFGDGFQKSKLIAGRRFWRIPVMDGEFLVESMVHVAKPEVGNHLGRPTSHHRRQHVVDTFKIDRPFDLCSRTIEGLVLSSEPRRSEEHTSELQSH